MTYIMLDVILEHLREAVKNFLTQVGGTIPITTGTLVLVIDNPYEDTITQF